MSGITQRDLLAPLPLLGDARLPTDTECAWLAGFVDGEGTIPNTNLANMARARVLLRSIRGRDVRVGKPDRKDRRPIYVIAIQNQPDIKVILELIRPWLVGKRPQAELMLAYIEAAPSRLVARSPSQRFGPGEWSLDAASATSEWPTVWPDPSLDDRDDELKRWWKLHFGA